jgi:hypothetical protein
VGILRFSKAGEQVCLLNEAGNPAYDFEMDSPLKRGKKKIISRADSIHFFGQQTLLFSQSFNHVSIFFTDIDVFYDVFVGSSFL